MKSPIFLFSLPRSGSTLLQRILMSHKDIASVAEPWVMLPFIYSLKKNGTLSEYGSYILYDALEDFIDNLPRKKDDYYEAISILLSTLYTKQCKNNELYFLDKTPRYYLIIPEIIKVFPDAKFIFLFRNPTHVMSSMMQTWSNGNLRKMYAYDLDLNYGPKALSDGYMSIQENAYALCYENYINDPFRYSKEICEYLDIEFKNNMLENFVHQDTKGRLGDPTGINEYSNISSNSLEKWKSTFNTPFRKKVLLNYILSIDKETLKIQGYDKESILDSIDNIETINKYFIKDRIDYIYSKLVRYTNANLYFGKKTSAWVQKRFIS